MMGVTSPRPVIVILLLVSGVTCGDPDSGDGDTSCDPLVNTTLPPPKIIPGEAEPFKHIDFFLNRTINK